MIIKKLVLHNFGVYASTNVFEFKGNISYLTGTNFIKNLNDLLNLAIEA